MSCHSYRFRVEVTKTPKGERPVGRNAANCPPLILMEKFLIIRLKIAYFKENPPDLTSGTGPVEDMAS